MTNPSIQLIRCAGRFSGYFRWSLQSRLYRRFGVSTPRFPLGSQFKKFSHHRDETHVDLGSKNISITIRFDLVGLIFYIYGFCFEVIDLEQTNILLEPI